MTDRGAKPKQPWLTKFFRRGIGASSTAGRQPETGLRDLFAEVPSHQLPAAATQEARQRAAFFDALRHLTKTQSNDTVEDLDHSIKQLREEIERIFRTLPNEYRSADRIRDLDSIVYQLTWLMERRLEQFAILRANIRTHCPSGLAEWILRESARYRGLDPKATPPSRCGGEEHVYQIGEPRCDCGTVAVRVVESKPGSGRRSETT